jgi:hypothetical protein
MRRIGLIALPAILLLSACHAGNEDVPTVTVESFANNAGPARTARAGNKLVDFCESKYILEVPATTAAVHDTTRCKLTITNKKGTMTIEVVPANAVAWLIAATAPSPKMQPRKGTMEVVGHTYEKYEYTVTGPRSLQVQTLLVSDPSAASKTAMKDSRIVMKWTTNDVADVAEFESYARTFQAK